MPGSMTKTQQSQRPAEQVGLPVGWVDTAMPQADLHGADLRNEGRWQEGIAPLAGGGAELTNGTTAAGTLER